VLLEAGSVGIPVVTTDMPGCRDAIRHEWNGLLIPPRDIPALSTAIVRLVSNPEERELMGGRSRQHIETEFSLTKVATAHATLYERLLHRS